MTSAKLRTQIEESEKVGEGMKSQRAASQQRLAVLQNERKQLLLPARLKNHQASQKRIQEIAAELSAVRQTVEDDEYLLDEMLRQIREATIALGATEFDDKRNEIREMLESRLAGNAEQRLAEAVENVQKIFAELSADYDQAACELKAFDGRLNHQAEGIKRLAQTHAEMISVQLERTGVPSPLNFAFCAMLRKRDFSTTAALALRAAIVEIGLLEPRLGSK
jgi:hypothetical protein